jgi:hypothetical protein
MNEKSFIPNAILTYINTQIMKEKTWRANAPQSLRRACIFVVNLATPPLFELHSVYGTWINMNMER